ncbi:hypothetical protein [Fructobacillus cardui]|uniref:hypothetical protein n=1 Tax=Fructobacillus cardui TaxID=2893170 RepID=UPI00200A8E3E|nr:hypothetical protein [Fructobacillus cardui]MCK8628192.1 hypothetical protein [Fructobacillus cardui]
MRIISLQSVGLGQLTQLHNENVYIPYWVAVGQPINSIFGNETGVKVIRIEEGDEWYMVYTSDGHWHIFPANQYIAEWEGKHERD